VLFRSWIKELLKKKCPMLRKNRRPLRLLHPR